MPALPRLPVWAVCVDRLRHAIRRGQCWSCETTGHRLVDDPMARGTVWTAICPDCAHRRRGMLLRYNASGTLLVPDRRVEPIG